MEHLSRLELARLVDEAQTEAEREHLEACPSCRDTLDSLRQQTQALGALPDLRPPQGDWAVLHARLVSDGLVRRGSTAGWGLAVTPTWMKVAAAVVLFVGGAAAGVATVRSPVTADFRGFVPAGETLRLASDPASMEEAVQQVEAAQQLLQDALAHYRRIGMMSGEAGQGLSQEARLAALEYLVLAGQAALREAPADPYINGFLASTVVERDLALRRVSSGGADWF